MEIIRLNKESIDEQHICCGFSDKKCQSGYQKKKEWLKKQFDNGYNFLKLKARAKVLIEYVPIEYAWLPLEGKNFMVINCFWVSGKYKGKGYGKQLLNLCREDSKEMDGIVTIAGSKKIPFMSDPKFLERQGFEVIDEAPPFFMLYGLRFNSDAEFPQIKESAKTGESPVKQGIAVYYSDTCVFNDYYINTHMVEYARRRGLPIEIHHIENREEAHKMPVPWVINSVFFNGRLLTLEMKPDRHIDKLLS